MNDKRQLQQGFTVIEAIIGAMATAIVVLVVGTILALGLRTWRMNAAWTQLRRDLAFASTLMARDVRESSYDNLEAQPQQLSVLSAVTNRTVLFEQQDDRLVQTVDGSTNTLELISEHLQTFEPLKRDDGVQLTLIAANPEFSITVTNQLFINTRN